MTMWELAWINSACYVTRQATSSTGGRSLASPSSSTLFPATRYSTRWWPLPGHIVARRWSKAELVNRIERANGKTSFELQPRNETKATPVYLFFFVCFYLSSERALIALGRKERNRRSAGVEATLKLEVGAQSVPHTKLGTGSKKKACRLSKFRIVVRTSEHCGN
jgi:hypothetical protein